MSLQADADLAGKTVRCPGCNAKLQIPEMVPKTTAPSLPPPSAAMTGGREEEVEEMEETSAGGFEYSPERRSRGGWVETDHANVSFWVSLGIGVLVMGVIYGIMFALKAPAGAAVTEGGKPFTVYLSDLFVNRGWVPYAETFLFSWALGILYLKVQKLRHQRRAMLLDVLPKDLGEEINAQTVGTFIDHVYNLPARLRDSLMVNRMRKGLEHFEARQNNQEVATMMQSQSDIEANSIAGSYAISKVFLWAIPILGFIGTVLGISEAISGFSSGTAGSDDMDALMSSIDKVTGGLGVAFDTTLLALVLSIFISFPIAGMQKAEEDNLNMVDSYCNQHLLARLNDGAGVASGDMGGMMDTLVKAVAQSQKEFLKDFNEVSKIVRQQSESLEKRAEAHRKKVEEEFTNAMKRLQTDASHSVSESSKHVTQYVTALEKGIRSLNEVLTGLGEKQVVIQQVKRRGWFSRD